MKYDLVSVIMPMFNSEKYVSKTISSVLSQSVTNWELIIVDDVSTDHSVDIVKKIASSDGRVKLYTQTVNKGAAAARNFAINKANGRYLAFLDSDDIWKSDKLEKQLSFMCKRNVSFSCTYYGKIDENGIDLNHIIKSKSVMNYNQLLIECPGNSTVVYDSKIIGRVFIPEIKKRNDYLMWLRVIKQAKEIYCLPNDLSFHRVRKDSISSNKLSLVKYHWKIYRKYESLNIFKSTYILLRIVSNSFFNQLMLKLGI